jgi:peptidoglycan/xylan/chitin deacetylase (PgdA/CDA1 family)
MRGVFGVLVIAAASLVAGSWIGVGRPDMDAVRSAYERVRTTTSRSASAPRSPTPMPSDAPPLPQETDPSLVPSFAAWPSTNPDRSIRRAWMVAEGRARKPGDARRLVTLTFDDGPSPDVTPQVLKLLARHKARATFFVIGRYLDGESTRARRSREVLKKIVSAGHLVGNHTHDHANLTAVSHEEMIAQIDSGAESIERVTGKRPLLFRPPYGRLDDVGQRAARDRNLELLLWSVEARDMQRGDPDEMFTDLVAQLDYKEGGVVLLHDVKGSSVVVLKRLLEFIRDRPYDPARPDRWGYELVDLPEYLRAVAESPLPYTDRDDLESARETRESVGRAKHKAPAAVIPGQS